MSDNTTTPLTHPPCVRCHKVNGPTEHSQGVCCSCAFREFATKWEEDEANATLSKREHETSNDNENQ